MLRSPPQMIAPMPLMLKRRSVPGPFDLDAIGLVHQRLQRLHARLELAVVERADVEVEILERLRAHAGELRHRRRRPAQHDPFRFLHPLVLHRAHFLRDQLHLLGRHIGQLGDVVAAAQADVGVHLFHARELVNRGEIELPLRRFERELARDAAALDLGERNRACFSRGADERDRHLVRHVERLDQDRLVPLQSRGILDQQLREFIEAGVVHRQL